MARWGILWKPLRFSLSQNIRIANLAMMLHNFCIDSADGTTQDMMRQAESIAIAQYTKRLTQSTSTLTATSGLPGRRSRVHQSITRNNLVAIVEERGLLRPNI